MRYRDMLLTYFFVRDVVYDLLALRRFIRRVLFGVFGVIAVLLYVSQNGLWHTVWHRPVWAMTDQQIQVSPILYPDYRDYMREHNLEWQPAALPWRMP